MNTLALDGMPRFAGHAFAEILLGIKEAGFDGVQFAEIPAPDALNECRRMQLDTAGSGRVNVPGEAFELANRLAAEGMACGTVHLGWGLEDDEHASRLIEAILAASEKHRIPLYPETHRATLFQDMWRTVEFVRKFPELRFNGDFSHWYTGQEMVYGGFEKKLAFIQPVLERVRFMHGRIGNPGCMQVALTGSGTGKQPYLDHFRQLWTAAMSQFLQQAVPGDYLCFAPELLSSKIYYAREFPTGAGEESDRWQQSLLLAEIARDCFVRAQAETVSAR
jgi:hypothetical protein